MCVLAGYAAAAAAAAAVGFNSSSGSGGGGGGRGSRHSLSPAMQGMSSFVMLRLVMIFL